jgi:outer membrane protein TolC
MVRDQLKKIDVYAHHYRLYRDRIAPLAQQAVQAARIDYESGKTGFSELINACQTAQEAESKAIGHLMNYRIAVAELETLAGADPLNPAPHSASQ